MKPARKKNGKLVGPVVYNEADTLHGRDERTRVKRDLRRGIEPQKKYTTGKYITD